jgi:signal transduction histidine kinase
VHVGVHGANMALVMALPLWAHRVVSGGLGRLPVERQVRRNNPMPTVSAIVLPPLAAYVLAVRGADTWALGYLLFVLLAVIVLNALRHTRLSREAHQLSGELARMAEERRQLLASMVRALEDDRRRTVSELHSQAVGSLSTLGTVIQTACVSLPAATASVVREAIAQLQGDLNDRAEELRLLLAAMRPPAFDAAGARSGDDAVLSAALRAYAAELADGLPGAHPEIRISVSPALELDRSTMTIVYRIAQEALLNAVRHAHGTRVTVSVGAEDVSGAVIVEVTDDGVGFDPAAAAEGSGLASMRLFTDVGRGELTVRSSPGEGTVVRSRLGGRTPPARPPAAWPPAPRPVTPAAGPADGPDPEPAATATLVPPAAGGRHLRLVPTLDGPAGVS